MCNNTRMKQTTEQRFWSHVRKTDTCWLWTGSKRNKGYGAFVWSYRDMVIQGRAHRFSWELVNGKIPKGLCCLHKCDNPSCVRPDHLWIGTKKDNNADMVAKNRHVPGGTHCGSFGKWKRGACHHNAKLTHEIVYEIRKDHSTGMGYIRLGKKYGISMTCARKVVKNITWSKAPESEGKEV